MNLKKIPIETFERILDLKKLINEDKITEENIVEDHAKVNHIEWGQSINKEKGRLPSTPSGLLQFSDIQSKNTKFSFKHFSFLKQTINTHPESGIGWLDDYLRTEANQREPLTATNIMLKFNDASSVIDMDNNIEVDGELIEKSLKI